MDGYSINNMIGSLVGNGKCRIVLYNQTDQKQHPKEKENA